MISQGTISVLFGCHDIVHSILVIKAWRHLYGKWPSRQECACILLHDIGHIGKNYLDDVEQKNQHWILGAALAGFFFGDDAYELTAGHCKHSGVPESKMYKADKYSWYIAPTWWLYLSNLAEPKLHIGYGNMESIRLFRKQVRESIESGEFAETHTFYTERTRKPTLTDKYRQS